MAKRTLKERIIAGILADGGQRVKITGKSEVFAYPRLPGKFLYVGNGGSLRAGRTKTESIPYDKLKAHFLAQQAD